MIQIDHPNVIKLYEIFEDKRYIYLVMEMCSGGELFDRIYEKINEHKTYTEKEAARIFKQMMTAICHCHSNKICHRDLKPENLLFLNKSDEDLKVIDFGLSRVFGEKDHIMHTKVGTAYYVSPEILKGDYDEKCDIWSSGVILYILLTGIPPFNGESDNDIYRKIAKKKFSYPSPGKELNKIFN
jgi:calcium-dependent protein kinase